jgi:hypothetical protein
MATSAPQGLSGSAEDYDTLSPEQSASLKSAISMLRPHADHPAIGGAIGQLQGALGETDDGSRELEKAAAIRSGIRSALAKGENADPAQESQARRLERDGLRKSGSVGIVNAEASRRSGVWF